MKKSIIILLVSILILSCSNENKEKEVLVFGTAPIFPPFIYLNETGDELLGFDMALANKIAQTRDSILQIEIMDFDQLIPALQNGEIDIAICGMTITDARKELINFSLSYYEASQVALVRKDNIDSFRTIMTKEELGVSKKIASLLGSTGGIIANNIAIEHPVLKLKSWDLAVDELLSENIDVVILDRGIARIFLSTRENLHILPIQFETEHYGVAISKENRELLASVNDTISRMINSGEYIQLVESHINNYLVK